MIDHRAHVLPAEPLPVRLMNTLWAERGVLHDDLADRDGVEAWLQAMDLTSEPVSPADEAAARQLRDAVRATAAMVTHDERPGVGRAVGLEPSLEVINSLAALARATRLILGEHGLTPEVAADAGVEAALARLAAETIQFFSAPVTKDLRACLGPRCVLYFVKDHPRRAWCDGACGTRARASRYYRLHRDDE